jgi:hypothetical protein
MTRRIVFCAPTSNLEGHFRTEYNPNSCPLKTIRINIRFPNLIKQIAKGGKMKFYKEQHKYYCGIDLHERIKSLKRFFY